MQALANKRRLHSRCGSSIMHTWSNILQVKIDFFAKSTSSKIKGNAKAGNVDQWRLACLTRDRLRKLNPQRQHVLSSNSNKYRFANTQSRIGDQDFDPSPRAGWRDLNPCQRGESEEL